MQNILNSSILIFPLVRLSVSAYSIHSPVYNNNTLCAVFFLFLFSQGSHCVPYGPCIIRTYDECDGRIEKSVPRITVLHHEACRVMTNGDPEGWIFLSYPHTNIGFFFFLTIVFYIRISFQKSLNTLRCNFT